MTDLVDLDSLEILAIVDNELDPISPCPNGAIQYSGGIPDIIRPVPASDVRGPNAHELGMDNICCGAHGLSLLITARKGDKEHTILFDTGPTESIWQQNARRLSADIGKVEVIQLSHWHRDHSGGMLRALEMINAAKMSTDIGGRDGVVVDLHPDRPDFRGVQPPGMPVVTLEADPTFEEIEKAGGRVEKNAKPHIVLDDMFIVSGEIPRTTVYETGMRFGMRFESSNNTWLSDEKMHDERFLACKLKGKGVVMITGCGHAGVVNSAKNALELVKNSPLYAVVGGFHLADAQPGQIQSSVAALKALDVKLMLAGHCTGWRAKFEMERQMPGRLVPSFVGSKYIL